MTPLAKYNEHGLVMIPGINTSRARTWNIFRTTVDAFS
jgi:hypothetical protein